jgi:uncharacterized surface protein with fasciclin (FAS1) repeats
MKTINHKYSTIMKMRITILLAAALSLFNACSDDVGDKYVTFEEELITSFLEADPDSYSEFLTLLNASGLNDLLNAYGTYTCFAPTNEAVETYYKEKGVSFEQLSDSIIKEIVFNHIIPITITSDDFQDGAITTANLNDRYLYIKYTPGEKTIMVNETAPIIRLDQIVHNGVVHTVGKVLEVSRVQLPEVVASYERFSLFCEALEETRLSDSLRLMTDESYVHIAEYVDVGGTTETTPAYRKFGYTLFVESNETLAKAGINTLDDLKEYAAEVYDRVYPEDRDIDDPSDRRNSLNRFVAYHILDRMQAANEFITAGMEFYSVPNTVLYEYMETMCPNTLLEVQTGNLFNKKKNGDAVGLLEVNMAAENGVFHEIDRILVYDVEVRDDVLNKRIRMDVASFFPELATNKLRVADENGNFKTYVFPLGYLKYLTHSEGSEVKYWGQPGWRNYQGDEFYIRGKYDFTLRLPPVPAGTYEVRLGYIANSSRGVAQIYFDGEACGIPLDMTKEAVHSSIGWIEDANTSDNGIENDKMMRNRGYLKGPNTVWCESKTLVLRNFRQSIRRILITKTFDTAEPHRLRIKSVEERTDREFHLDYIEFVPSSYWEKEGRD